MVKHEPADVRRLQLFNAALEICAERGYPATRVEDIAAAAGLSKGALYHHFKGKQDLFIQLFLYMMEQMEQASLEVLASTNSATEAFRQLNEGYAEMIQTHPAMMRGLLEFYMSNYRDDEISRIFTDFYQRLVEVLAPLIQRGMEQGEFRQDLDVDEITWTYFTAADGLLFLHFYLNREQQAMERMHTLVELLLDGIRTR